MGGRSRVAASALSRAGFGEVHGMEGGIRAWKGLTAEGFPEVSMTLFSEARSPEELISLAWLIEEGTRWFYETVSGMLEGDVASGMFKELVRAEERHKETLAGLYAEWTRKAPDGSRAAFPTPPERTEMVMEGGVRVVEALQWAQGKSAVDILELSISMEANAYDRYMFMADRMTDERSRQVFTTLCAEEKRHLRKLTELFEERL